MGCVVLGAGTPIQDATCGAGEGDMSYVHEGTYVKNLDVGKRLTRKIYEEQTFIHIGSCLNEHKTVLCSNGEVIV